MNRIETADEQRFSDMVSNKIIRHCIRCGAKMLVSPSSTKVYCTGNCQRKNHYDGVNMKIKKERPGHKWTPEMNKRWDDVMENSHGISVLIDLFKEKS